MRLAFLALPLMLACAPQPRVSAAGNDAGADVFSNPEKYAGRTLEIEARFEGYRAGDCRFAPRARTTSLSRSDWLVRRDDYCLYVTGDPPAGLDPIDPNAAGRMVTLRARVIQDESGKHLLQAARQ